MKPDFRWLLILALASSFSWAAPGHVQRDPFQQCMMRTETDRRTCTAGCGMIVGACYEEAILPLERDIEAVSMALQQSGNDECVSLGTLYVQRHSELMQSVADKAEARPGWINAELRLNLTRQKLGNLGLIAKECS